MEYAFCGKLSYELQITLFHVWDVFVMFSIIPSTFLISYQAAFNATIAWQWAIIYAGDVIYITSMGLRFFRSYVTNKGEIVTDKETIVFHYLRTSFLYDLITILPLEIFAIAQNKDDISYVMALLRANRGFRLYRVWIFLCKRHSSQ